MKKQNIKKTLDSNCLYELDARTLREAAAYLIERAESYEAQGYADIAFNIDTDYDGGICLMIIGSRLETDAEANARVESEAREAKHRRECDLRILKSTAERLGIKIENI